MSDKPVILDTYSYPCGATKIAEAYAADGIIMPTCPMCNTVMVPITHHTYYDEIDGWTCECDGSGRHRFTASCQP